MNKTFLVGALCFALGAPSAAAASLVENQRPAAQDKKPAKAQGKKPAKAQGLKRQKAGEKKSQTRQVKPGQVKRAPGQKGQGEAQISPADGGTMQAADERIDSAVNVLEQKARGGQAGAADFEALSKALAESTKEENPKSARIRERYKRMVDDLSQRARNAVLKAEDVAVLREQVIDARLDRAIDRLKRKTQEKKLNRGDFQRLATLVQQRADAAKDVDPQAAVIRKKLNDIVMSLEERAVNASIKMEHFDELGSSLNQARTQRALADLERRSLAKSASEADIKRVNDTIDDQKESSPSVDPQLWDKFRAAVARLEGRALRGEVTPEEFNELRAQLTTRARNAASKSDE